MERRTPFVFVSLLCHRTPLHFSESFNRDERSPLLEEEQRYPTVEWGTNGHGENKSECAETGMVESPILVEFSFSTFKIYTCLLQRNDRFLFQVKYTSFSRFRAIIGLELFLYVQFQSINYS